MIPERYASFVYALFRIVFAFLYVSHGVQKWFGLFGGIGGQAVPPLGSMLGIAGPIETVLGTLLLVGLFVRPAAFLASGQMAVAFFTVHMPRGGWPIQNQGELAVMFCFAFLYIASRGAGIWSLDALRRGHRGARSTDASASIPSAS
jgi:putative oxidoreductase